MAASDECKAYQSSLRLQWVRSCGGSFGSEADLSANVVNGWKADINLSKRKGSYVPEASWIQLMSPHDRVVVSFGALSAVFLAAVIGSALTPKPASHQVVGTVVAVFVSGARWPHTGIVVRAPHAIETQAFLREDDPELCRVGDLVNAIQTGVSLKVDPYSCHRPHKARSAGSVS
jgi:hypothetical protein